MNYLIFYKPSVFKLKISTNYSFMKISWIRLRHSFHFFQQHKKIINLLPTSNKFLIQKQHIYVSMRTNSFIYPARNNEKKKGPINRVKIKLAIGKKKEKKRSYGQHKQLCCSFVFYCPLELIRYPGIGWP